MTAATATLSASLAEAGTVGGDPAGTEAAEALALLVELRDADTGEHSSRVAELARATAVGLGLDGRRAEDAYLAGWLHDVGKVSIPDSILHKRTELTAAEWRLIHRHPTIGADIVAQIPSLARLAPFIRSHHERYGGGGYPHDLRGEGIPLEGRIIAVADAFDAMTSDRAYRPRMSAEEARARLRECAGSQFDPTVAAAFERQLAGRVTPLAGALS
jgi:HD-GYP domain-containing protein (c-di-GMP phosphodiesterase class II)